MLRRASVSLLIVLLAGVSAEAQQIGFLSPGSTPQGDYLRGVGVAALGEGWYNRLTAEGNYINAQTFIMLNEYIWTAYKNEMKENADYRREMRARNAENYRQIQERIRDHPESLDVTSGNALNNVMRRLWDPMVSDSASRSVQIPLDAGVIRNIPFKLGEKGETFSMARLSIKGTLRRAVAFQDPAFAPFCAAYQRAVDNALELAMDQKMTEQAIEDIEKAFRELEDKFRRTSHLLDPDHQRAFSEAKDQLDKMRRSPRLFQTAPLQPIFKEIDSYAGTTVDELRLFMRKHNLNFAPAETHDEKAIYPRLYAALKEHLAKVTGAE